MTCSSQRERDRDERMGRPCCSDAFACKEGMLPHGKQRGKCRDGARSELTATRRGSRPTIQRNSGSRDAGGRCSG